MDAGTKICLAISKGAITTVEKCVKWIDKHIKERLKKMEGEKIQPYLENLV